MERVEFSSSFKSFIGQTKDKSKVAKYLYYYLNQDYSDTKSSIVARHIKADKINYLTLRKDGTISYLPFGRELKRTENGEWARDGRQQGKPAKTITQIMSNAMLRSITSRDLEIFSNFYKGQASDLHTILEARGEALADVYGMDSKFGSCMGGKSNRSKLELYVMNPEVVGVLYVLDTVNNVCASRALIWTDSEGNRIIDRVYGSEEFQSIFRDYAREIGAYKKSYDGAGSSPFITPNGDIIEDEFRILLKHADCDGYPYVDTFSFLDFDAGVLSNLQGDDATRHLQCTDGEYGDIGRVECLHRSGTYLRDHCRWSEYHAEFIHEDDVIEINDEYYHRGDGEIEQAFKVGRYSYVLVDDCKEVEVIDPDCLDGLTIIDDVCTQTYYKTPSGDLIHADEDTFSVFVIDGEIKGRVD